MRLPNMIPVSTSTALPFTRHGLNSHCKSASVIALVWSGNALMTCMDEGRLRRAAFDKQRTGAYADLLHKMRLSLIK
jgi:hypothetical protein